METKELKIQVPEGYEIDKENSTFECIKFKEKVISYQDVLKELGEPSMTTIFYNSVNHLYKIEALNKLIFVAKYLNNGWVPDFNSYESGKFFIGVECDKIYINHVYTRYSHIIYFKSEELAQQAIKILGEETIKLALSHNY